MTDTVGRLGGEEFALVLPETSASEAVVAAERLRGEVTRRLSRDGLVITASFGISMAPDHGMDLESLAHGADRALYAAKRNGRDRVVLFDPELTAHLVADDESSVTRRNALITLAESLDLRDSSTARHSQTVADFAALVAERLGFEPEHVERVRLAGMLHDIGKLSMPDSVLHKPGRLTTAERELIQRHPELGARLLEGAGLQEISVWVRCHHERVDGEGYPRGLAGGAIPIESRILSVADAFEAMIAKRPYRDPMTRSEAIAELERNAGTQFDERVVRVFVAAMARRPVQGVSA
jgi:putative nucleotidyltransferase with HDIG domain